MIKKEDIELFKSWLPSVEPPSLQAALSDFAKLLEAGCDHSFLYGGVVHHSEQHPLPGTGARARWYEDWFYCTKCLEIRYKNRRLLGSTYQEPLPGSMPKGSETRGY